MPAVDLSALITASLALASGSFLHGFTHACTHEGGVGGLARARTDGRGALSLPTHTATHAGMHARMLALCGREGAFLARAGLALKA
jgi:hypothetical protein